MFFSFGLFSSTLLIFFLHGIIFAILLAIKGFQQDNKPHFWLAAFTLLCSLYIAPFMFGYAGWYAKDTYRDILFYIPFQQLFLMPPLLFFYVKNLLNPSFVFQKKDWGHFIPAILYFIYSLVVWVTDKLILQEYYFYADGKDKDLDLWYQVAGFVFMVYYLFQCLHLYQQYRKNTYETLSFADSILFNWIQQFLKAFLILLLLRILFFILNPEWDNFGGKYWYYLSFSILFYYISISGYTHAVKMGFPFPSNPFDLNRPLAQLLQTAEKTTSVPVKNKELEISAYDLDLKMAIEELMNEEKFFKHPDLTLFDLAKQLSTHPKKVSNAINKGFQMNFNDFVNSYRIKEVIQKIHLKEGNLKTLLGIALEAGFNSKSTFNRAFKKQMKCTPKEFFNKKAEK